MRLKVNTARFKKVCILSIFILASVIILGCLLYAIGIRLNLSSSLPLGVWKIDKSFSHIEKGDHVWFTPTKEIAKFALQRDYLERNNQVENNCVPLLKIVYGLPGDTYTFHDDFIRINNVPVEKAKRRRTDSKGRPMPQISNGIVRPNHLFVLTLNTHSFDSRYYGTIPIKNVKGTAIPILTWKN
jgi:conjugative transfer signal peptidase TraF